VGYHIPEKKMESMAWKHPISPSKKFKTTVCAGKVMATVILDVQEIIIVDVTPRGATLRHPKGSNSTSEVWPA
jgi:hypothetical protein